MAQKRLVQGGAKPSRRTGGGRRGLRRETYGGFGRERLRPVDSYTPEYEDVQALSLVEWRYRPESIQKSYLEKTWMYNLAFVLGHQHHVWSNSYWGLIYRPKTPQYRIREVRNMCRAFAERRVAMLSGFQPRFKVWPQTNEHEDEAAARLGSKLCPHYWQLHDMPTKSQYFAYWAVTCGTSFLKVTWDPTAGEQFVGPDIDENGYPISDSDGMPRERLYFTGDVRTEAVSPFEIVMDPMAESIDEAEWIMHVTRRPIEWVDRHYPELGPYVQGDMGDDREYTQKYVLNLVGPGGFLSGVSSDDSHRYDWVTVKEYYERPSPAYPRGRLVIVAGGVVLQNGDNPCPEGHLPFIDFKDMLVPGRFWGQSNLDNLITPQRNYNRLVSNYLEHIMLTAKAKVAVPQTANLAPAVWNNEIGEHVVFAGPVPPAYINPPPLAPESEREMNRIRGDFDNITSTYGPERGQYQGKMSGRAIDLLVEQGQAIKQPIIYREKIAFEKWARMVLQNVQKFCSERRILKVVGRNSEPEIRAFTGADLRGNTDARIEAASMRPKSRTLVINELQILAGIGYINPQKASDRNKINRALEYEDEEELNEDLDRIVARHENAVLVTGNPVEPPKPWEDQEVHVEALRELMNNEEWKRLPPEAQRPALEHYEAHLRMGFPQGFVGPAQEAGVTQALQPPEPTFAEGEAA